MAPQRSFERGPSGDIRLRLSPDERALLRTVRTELQLLIDDSREHPDLRRLFPPAHDDPEEDARYGRLVRDELVAGRQHALATLGRTLDRDTLTPPEADAWLTALNDARLVLGTRLDVQEEMDFDLDPGDPRARELAIYAYLSWLQEQLVEAMAAGLR